ncbi:MAG: nucleotidyltransferase domain-containing protein [Oscillospiraceae bacterium]|nr:nucleotidyltransferase domain-containing protein [Oscillospiraceae bacterium]
MKQIIINKIEEIERTQNVRIIHAVESGSRAWGFASPDSDYDVRFIYIRPLEYYLRLEKTSDIIEYQLDETLDINGWDLQKALRLLHKSNPTLFEWNNSPIIYKTTPEWQKIRNVINDYFRSKNGLYHYLSMAKSNYREYLKTDIVKLKKYFYVIRPVLACKWIIDKNSPPPMLFSELCSSELEPSMKPFIDKLIEIKINTPEISTGKRIDEINQYIDKSIAEIENIISDMPENNNNNWKALDELFISFLM